MSGDRRAGPSFWKTQAAVWAIYLVMIYTTFLPMAGEGMLKLLLVIKGLRTLFGFGLSSILRYMYRGAVKIWSLPRVVAVVALGSITFGAVWTLLSMVVSSVVNPSFNWATASRQSPHDSVEYALTLVAWSAGYFFVQYWMEWQAERERSLRASSLAQTAELQLLRYQLNPHFLFNALNSVRASVDEDAQRAKRMITALAEFLRYSLLSESGEGVELREELAAIRNYLGIETIRYEEQLEVSYQIDPRAESEHVPPFLICPLVENAVKHGMRSSTKPLRLKISASIEGEQLRVEVANTGTLCGNGFHGHEDTGTGVRNVRERVAQIYGQQGRFELTESEGWVRAHLDLPAKVKPMAVEVAR